MDFKIDRKRSKLNQNGPVNVIINDWLKIGQRAKDIKLKILSTTKWAATPNPFINIYSI